MSRASSSISDLVIHLDLPPPTSKVAIMSRGFAYLESNLSHVTRISLLTTKLPLYSSPIDRTKMPEVRPPSSTSQPSTTDPDPQIGEVARIVHFLRTHLRNRKVASVVAPDDPLVFGKAGCTAAEFAAAMAGTDGARLRTRSSRGKYFWLEMKLAAAWQLMHFGMTGTGVHLSNVHTLGTTSRRRARGEGSGRRTTRSSGW